MRTKTLLIAVAALAVGIGSSLAQTYSQNIVGYANIPTPSSGTFYMITVPFTIGATNGANEVFVPGSLPQYSYIMLWDPGTSGYTTYIADTDSFSGWDDSGYVATDAPIVPVGQGFFLNPSGDNVTNVFAGTVAVNVGTSNQMILPNSGTFYLVSSVVPYNGAVTNGTASNGGLNLNGLPIYSYIMIWDPASSGYTTYIADSNSGCGWDDSGYIPLDAPPTLDVGQSFFINLTDAYTWTVGL